MNLQATVKYTGSPDFGIFSRSHVHSFGDKFAFKNLVSISTYHEQNVRSIGVCQLKTFPCQFPRLLLDRQLLSSSLRHSNQKF